MTGYDDQGAWLSWLEEIEARLEEDAVEWVEAGL